MSDIILELKQIIADIICPTKRFNWYHDNGYTDFWDCYDSNIVHKDEEIRKLWQFVDAECGLVRSYGANGQERDIEAVMLRPAADKDQTKPGSGLSIVNFFGRGDCYEEQLPHLLKQAKATGATMYVFNPAGLAGSGGSTLELADLVNDGIALVNMLLARGIDPNTIVLQGYRMGAVVQGLIARQLLIDCNIKVRQINVHSFYSISDALANIYDIPPRLKNRLQLILRTLGWEIEQGVQIRTEWPYQCALYLQHSHNSTIHKDDNSDADSEKTEPKQSKGQAEWYNHHTKLQAISDNYTGNLYQSGLDGLRAVRNDNGKMVKAFDVLNRYFKDTRKLVEGSKVDKPFLLRAKYFASKPRPQFLPLLEIVANMIDIYPLIAASDEGNPMLSNTKRNLNKISQNAVKRLHDLI